MLLHDYFRSSAAYRVRIALNLKGVSYERHAIDLRAGEQRTVEHRARNPQGFVPALDIGGAVLSQSYAIIDWLDATYPEPRLIPREPIARARALAQAMTIACDIHPLNNLRVLQRLKAMGVAEDARDDWYRHWIAEGFDALEATAGAGPFLGGDAPGIADVFLVPQMFNARRLATPLDAYPRLVAIDDAAAALPAFAAAHPDRVAPDQ
jgi:maleylacetoacetate isomerase